MIPKLLLRRNSSLSCSTSGRAHCSLRGMQSAALLHRCPRRTVTAHSEPDRKPSAREVLVETLESKGSPHGTPIVDYLVRIGGKQLSEEDVSALRETEGTMDLIDSMEKLRRLRIAYANKNGSPWNKGKRHKPETVRKIREAALRNVKENPPPPSQPRPRSEEERKKTSEGLRLRYGPCLHHGITKHDRRNPSKATIAYAVFHAGGRGCAALMFTARPSWPRHRCWLTVEEEQLREEKVKAKKAKRKVPARERLTPEQLAESRATMRARVSEKIKQKWADPAFRERAVRGMHKARGILAAPGSDTTGSAARSRPRLVRQVARASETVTGDELGGTADLGRGGGQADSESASARPSAPHAWHSKRRGSESPQARADGARRRGAARTKKGKATKSRATPEQERRRTIEEAVAQQRKTADLLRLKFKRLQELRGVVAQLEVLVGQLDDSMVRLEGQPLAQADVAAARRKAMARINTSRELVTQIEADVRRAAPMVAEELLTDPNSPKSREFFGATVERASDWDKDGGRRGPVASTRAKGASANAGAADRSRSAARGGWLGDGPGQARGGGEDGTAQSAVPASPFESNALAQAAGPVAQGAQPGEPTARRGVMSSQRGGELVGFHEARAAQQDAGRAESPGVNGQDAQPVNGAGLLPDGSYGDAGRGHEKQPEATVEPCDGGDGGVHRVQDGRDGRLRANGVRVASGGPIGGLHGVAGNPSVRMSTDGLSAGARVHKSLLRALDGADSGVSGLNEDGGDGLNGWEGRSPFSKSGSAELQGDETSPGFDSPVSDSEVEEQADSLAEGDGTLAWATQRKHRMPWQK